MQMHNASQHLETILEHSRHLYTMSRLHQHHYYIYIYIAIVGGKYSKSNITEEKRMDPCIGGQPGPKRRRCKCKYKIRWFYSKGAFLVLVWVLLSGLSLSSSVTFRAIQPNQRGSMTFGLPLAILVSVVAVTILLLGWLANRLGAYKAAKFGFILLFLAAFVSSVATLFLECDFMKNQYIANIFICSIEVLYLVGAGTVVISSLQLGLDQCLMLHLQVSRFAAWLVFTIYASKWIIDTLFNSYLMCLMNDNGQYPDNTVQLWSLFPVSCMSTL